eukprot:gene7654-11974_t
MKTALSVFLLSLVFIAVCDETVVVGNNQDFQYGVGSLTSTEPTLTNFSFNVWGKSSTGAFSGGTAGTVSLQNPTSFSIRNSDELEGACPGGFVKDVAVTETSTVVLCRDDTSGSYTQMVSGTLNGFSPLDTKKADVLMLVDSYDEMKSVFCGYQNCFFIQKSNGAVYALGSNTQNSLCRETASESPALINDLTSITQIAVGLDHTLFLDSSGAVKSCGSQGAGQIGRTANDITSRSTPVLILTSIAFIAAGNEISYAGNPTTFYRFGSGIATNSTNGLLIPTVLTLPTEMGLVSEFVSMQRAMYLWTTKGYLLNMGSNPYSQLSDGTTTPKPFLAERVIRTGVLANRTVTHFYPSAGDTLFFNVTDLTCFGTKYDSPMICNGNGTCTRIDTCDCFDGYGGNDCLLVKCSGILETDPSVCSGRGNCIDKNQCSCVSNYFGSNCENTFCYGKNSTEADICSSQGTCVDFNNCTCNIGYTGNNCQLPICNGKNSSDSNVCSSHGSCIAADTCNCTASYTGSNCEIPVCFGISASNPSVCSGAGNCTSPDNCVCQKEYQGTKCEQRKLIYDLLVSLCKDKPTCTINSTWENCILNEGPSCYCNAFNENGSYVKCSGIDVTDIKFINSGLNGTIVDLRGYTKLKYLDLSGNYIQKYPSFKENLPQSIESFIMNDITNGQAASDIDFKSADFPNLKNISLIGNNLCGPYPLGWKTVGLNLNLAGHTKTLWCDESINKDVCSLLPVTNPYFVIGDSNEDANITFSSTCKIDYSQLNCGNTESLDSTSNVGFTSSGVRCGTSGIKNLRNQIYLVWSGSNDTVSMNSSMYRIYRQHISEINGSTAGLSDQDIKVKIKLGIGIPKEIHQHVHCVGRTPLIKNISAITAINDKDDKIFCVVQGNRTNPDRGYISVLLQYSYGNAVNNIASKSIIPVPLFDPNTVIKSASMLGYSGEMKTIEIQHPLDSANYPITRRARNLILVSVNGTRYVPSPPEIGATDEGFISFSALNFYKSSFTNSLFMDGNTYVGQSTFMTNLGFQANYDLNNSPFAHYRINFNQPGDYYIFHQTVSGTETGYFFIGTNTSYAVRVNRTVSNSNFYPLASAKTTAPIIQISKAGVNDIFLWRGENNIEINKIVLVNTTAASTLNFAAGDIVLSDYDKFKTTFKVPKPGIAKINLLWKNPEGSESLVVSKPMDFASLETGTILGLHPYGALKGKNLKLSVYTNITEIDYQGAVTFHCGSSSGNYLTPAIQSGSIFTCELFLTVSSAFVNIKIFANHTITGELLPITSNFQKFYVFETVETGQLYPFANNQSVTSQEISITTQNLPVEFSKVYCRHVTNSDGVLYSKATRMSSTVATCTMKLPSITQLNSDDSLIGLWVNTSTSLGGDNSFYLSNKNLSHVVIKEPMSTNMSSVIPFNQTVPFSLNMTKIFGLSNYSIAMIGVSEFGSLDLNCDDILDCAVDTRPAARLPETAHIRLEIIDGTKKISFVTADFYILGKVTMYKVSPFPFVLDPLVNMMTVSMISKPRFNIHLDYYCLDSRSSTKIPVKKDVKNLLVLSITCDIQSNFIDEEFTISVHVNTSIPGLSDEAVSTLLPLSFNQLKISPSYIEKSQPRNFEILRNDSSKFVISPHYQDLNTDYSLKELSTTNRYDCVLGTMTTVCSQSTVNVPALDVYLSYFLFQKSVPLTVNFLDLMNISKPLLVYKSIDMDISPHATVVGKNIDITMTFAENTLRVDPRISNIEYYCNIQENGNLKYSATRINNNQMNCSIPYAGFNQTTITGYIRVPQISNDYLLISNNTATLFYIQPGLLDIDTSAIRFHYTSVSTNFMNFSATTIMDLSLISNVKLSLNTSDSYTNEQKNTLSISGSVDSEAKFTYGTSGRVNVFLEYVEGNERFSITTNQIEFVLVTKSTFTGFSPSVATTNVTNNVNMFSGFLAKDYGNVTFTTKYGESDPLTLQTAQTNFSVDGNNFKFTTDMYSATVITYLLSIQMTTYGHTLEILPSVPYKFIESNFFTPNHGLISGGETVEILQPKTTNKLITIGTPFNIDHIFNCSTILGKLVCITPTFNSTFSSFSSYNLYFTENQDLLSAKFVLYEKRTIARMFPTIFPISTSFPKFSLNVTLSSAIKMNEGVLVVELSGERTKYIEFAALDGTTSFKSDIDPSDLIAGIYQAKINYKNAQSLAFNEQFTFTDSKNVTFVDVDSILSITDCKTIVHLNEVLTVTVNREKSFPSNLSPFVKCKLGNTLVPTTRVTDKQYLCNVSSSVAGVQQISLWYVNDDAENGEILISPNSSPILFVEKISIQSVNPFTTMIGTTTAADIHTNYNLDIFGGNATYHCSLGSDEFTATLHSNGRFSCSLLGTGNARNESLFLKIKPTGCASGVDFSSNSIQYIYRKPVEIETISPFAKGFSNNIEDFTFDVSLSLKTGDTVVNEKGLICKYNSTHHGYRRSNARIEGNLIKCSVSISKFSESIAYLQVGLALNTTLFSVDSTYFSNLVKVVFYRQPLKFKNLTITDNSFSENFQIDMLNYENEFNYQLNFTEELSPDRSTIVNCVKGIDLQCKPNVLNPLVQPSNYNLSLIITKNNTPGVETILNFNSIVYFNNDNQLISAVPYFALFVAHRINPLKLQLSFGSVLNSQRFKFNCINSSNNEILSIATVENPGSANSTVTCTVKSSRVETLQLTVGIQINETNYQISTQAGIQFIDPIYMSTYNGFSTGNTEFSFIEQKGFPTLFKSDYNISLKAINQLNSQTITCNTTVGTLRYCRSPKVESKVYPKSIRFSIHIDDVEAISLTPWFEYFAVPSISNIFPSSLVDIFTTGKTIKLQSSSFAFSSKLSYKIKYVELLETQDCTVEATNLISCPISKNSAIIAQQVTLQLSMDGENFETLDKKLYLFTNDLSSEKVISASSNTLSPTTVANPNVTQISYSIVIPTGIVLPTNSCLVRFKDQFINEVTTATIENGNIKCEAPHLAQYSVYYPRTLSVETSLDGGTDYFGSQLIQYTGFDVVDFSPKVFLSGTTLKFSFVNFPKINLAGKKMAMQLKSTSEVIKFTCNSNMTSCIGESNPLDNKYSIEFIDDSQTRYFIPLILSEISVLTQPTVQIPTKKISRNMENMIYLTGTGLSPFTNSVKVRGIFDGKTVEASSVNVMDDKIGFLFSPIQTTVLLNLKKSFGNSIQISFNEGFDYATISSQIQLIDAFTFDTVAAKGTNSFDTTFSFQNTTLELKGTKLNESAIIKLENELFSYTQTIDSSDANMIEFIVPKFEFYSPSTLSFSFPIIATLGISLNDGIDFKTRSITIADKFANLFLVGIEPAIGERKTLNLTMQGANLKDVRTCEFKDSNSTLYYSIDKIIEGDSIICTFIYDAKYDTVNEVYLSLKNSFNDTSDTVVYYMIQNPMPQTITPSSGVAAGNYSVLITGSFDTRFSEIYMRIGSVKVDQPCKIINSTAVRCGVIANADVSIAFDLSYNRIDWYPTTSNFTFIPCIRGYGTSSYQEACEPCPLGQFKSNNGIEVCTDCPVDTYTDKIGSINCTSCPDKMKSPGSTTGLTSVDQCVCVNNSMVHPITKVCIDCPQGAICNPENVTLPKSQKGWWFSKVDVTIFYQCYPIERCLPDNADNCTVGYTDLRCGRCADGYYKSKLVCKKCNDSGITALLLIAAIAIIRPLESDDEDSDDDEPKKTNKIIEIIKSIFRSIVNDNIVPWETEHDFQFTINFEQGSEPEDNLKSMNEILEDVFSSRRAKRKLYLITRAGKRTAVKIAKKTKLDGVISQNLDKMSSRTHLVPEESIKGQMMPNGYLIKSEYNGSVSYVGSKSTQRTGNKSLLQTEKTDIQARQQERLEQLQKQQQQDEEESDDERPPPSNTRSELE